MIPTVFRNDYLRALSGMSRGGPGAGNAVLAVLDFAQQWVAAIDWADYETAMHTLEMSNAFEDPVIAEANNVRLELPTALT